MRMYDIIKKKRDGASLTEGEIQFFIDGYVKGEIPDYQAAAFLMAVYYKGNRQKISVDCGKASSRNFLVLS